MLGLQHQQLTTAALIEDLARRHGGSEIVSVRAEGDVHRMTYAQMAARARQVAGALDALQLGAGELVATLAWNGHRHLELYFGTTASGRLLHPLNPQLRPEQLAWIIGQARDSIVCFDMAFLPLIQAVHARCPSAKTWVALCHAQWLPANTGIPGLVAYEDWIAGHSSSYLWPHLDENSAATLCHTGGSSSHWRPVLHSHRSTVLHTLASVLSETLPLSAGDSVLPVVPMAQVNAWGLPFAAAMVGAKLVFAAPGMDGKAIYQLIEDERVTLVLGVPQGWPTLLGHMCAHQLRFSRLERVAIGGLSIPPGMLEALEKDYGFEVLAHWGSSERIPSIKNEPQIASSGNGGATAFRSSRAMHINCN
ncbi:AMP-binding protein [Burkholderiaceae bacterium UC74_6]